MTISYAARALILEMEGFNAKPDWPGGQSGVTIGLGYDLGYVTVDQFESDWGELLKPEVSQRLKGVIGLRALRARNRIGDLSDLRISRKAAEQVFGTKTLPIYEMRTELAFPGADALPEDARGALVSLVYNRGTSMVDNSPDDRRREMRAIREAVARGDLAEIAAQLRAMKRLWEGQHLGGLIARREEEAQLVESAVA
jgi:GH24 family phage-related lysozyme (muramidase)